MARIAAAPGRSRKPETGDSNRRHRAKPPLAGGDLLAVIDELDMLDLALETVPTLTLLAQMVANVQHHDPEHRDEIARLGARRGIDVDMTAPLEDAMTLDAAMAPDMIVEAVRWRLQRVSAALNAAGRPAPARHA